MNIRRDKKHDKMVTKRKKVKDKKQETGSKEHIVG